MDVKSIDVPDVEATAVPDTIGYSVPVGTAAVPANVVLRPVLIVMASLPPTCMAPLPSEFAFKPMLIAIPYSYKMLTEPASKVSVPLAVVTRTWSNTPVKVTPPAK